MKGKFKFLIYHSENFQIVFYLQVRAICGKHGLYLTLSLLETLLTHQDLGYQGEIK